MSAATPLPTRERQRLQTRAIVLEAGLQEIAERGLAGARIEHIARRAGVTRPTVYAHFPRKDDFLLAIYEEEREQAVQEMKARAGDARGRELVHRLVDAVYEMIGAVDPVLRREGLTVALRDQREMDWTGDLLFEFLRERLALDEARGELADDVSAEDLVRLLGSVFLGFLVLDNVPLEERRAASHRALDLVMRGAMRTA